jgi:hypothetical protein
MKMTLQTKKESTAGKDCTCTQLECDLIEGTAKKKKKKKTWLLFVLTSNRSIVHDIIKKVSYQGFSKDIPACLQWLV